MTTDETNAAWQSLLNDRESDGSEAADKGVFDPPHPGSRDPQDEDENRAYRRGFDQRRRVLGEAFNWA